MLRAARHLGREQATIRSRVCGGGLMRSGLLPYDDLIHRKVGYGEAARESILKRSTLLALAHYSGKEYSHSDNS